MSSYSQNFDGVTPPATPSGWTFDAQYTTTTAQSVSSPNSLVCTTAVANTNYFATYGTQDGDGGNVTISADFLEASGSSSMRVALLARGSASPLNLSSTTFYRCLMEFDGQIVAVQKVVSGTVTTIGSSAAISVAAATWYNLAFTLNGSVLQAVLQRLSDGYYYGTLGWQPTPATLLSTSDSSVTGQGYSGISMASNGTGGQTAYADNYGLSAIPTATPQQQITVVPIPFGWYPSNMQ